MKKYIKILIVFLILPFVAFAQEDDTEKEKVREEQTDVVILKK